MKIPLITLITSITLITQILYIERNQYPPDHHNTATMFQKGEINEASFSGAAAMRVFNVKTKEIITLLECPAGIIRDPEVSFDGQ